MENKNISFNHTLEQYNKKYKNRNYRLLKLTKKDVEDFDKKNPTKTKGYLLEGRKWWLIKDTYYEIPKAPRYTWFRNLNAGIQAGCCLLGAGVIATAVTVPLVLMNKGGDTPQPAPEEEKVEVEIDKSLSSDFKVTKIEKDSDGNTVISLEDISSEKTPKEIEIHKGEKVLEENTDYIIKAKDKKEEVTISKDSIKKYSGKIQIKYLYDEFNGEVSDEEWIAAFEYICKIKDTTNYSVYYELEDDENEIIKGNLKVDGFNQTNESNVNNYQKILSDGAIITYDDTGLIKQLLDKKQQDDFVYKQIKEFEDFTNAKSVFTFLEESKSYSCILLEGFNVKFKKKNQSIMIDTFSLGDTFYKFKNYGTTKITSMPKTNNLLEYSGTPTGDIYEFPKYTFSEGNATICCRINLSDVSFSDDKYISINFSGSLIPIMNYRYVIDETLYDRTGMSTTIYIPNSCFTSEKSKDFTFLISGGFLAGFGDYSCVLKVNQDKS